MTLSVQWKTFLFAWVQSYFIGMIFLIIWAFFNVKNADSIFGILIFPLLLPVSTLVIAILFEPVYGLIFLAYLVVFIAVFKLQNRIQLQKRMWVLVFLITLFQLLGVNIFVKIMPNFIA